ncbi:MAG: sensor histidine kinase [bacterium]
MKETILISYNEEYLNILIDNIISNAIKYNKFGGKIEITAEQKFDKLTLRFFDSGIGMSSIDKDNIFERFYRSNGNTQTGYGLGMAIVKDVCDVTFLRINVDSELSKHTLIEIDEFVLVNNT